MIRCSPWTRPRSTALRACWIGQLEPTRSSPTTTGCLALTLFDDPARGGDVYTRLNRWGRWAGDTARACYEGAHGGYRGDTDLLVQDTERLVERLVAL